MFALADRFLSLYSVGTWVGLTG